MIKIINNERFALAKNDKKLAENLIIEYTPFLKAITGKYIKYRRPNDFDDLFSVAMEAFNEALMNYEKEKGYFISFAKLVIKRKLLNYIKSQDRFTKREIPFSSIIKKDENKNKEICFETEDIRAKDFNNPCRFEIEAIRDECMQFEINFFKLRKYVPKAYKTKKICSDIINYIAKEKDLIFELKKNNRLPIKRIVEEFDINRKIVERHRQFIIVALIIVTGDYPCLFEYLNLERDVSL